MCVCVCVCVCACVCVWYILSKCVFYTLKSKTNQFIQNEKLTF